MASSRDMALSSFSTEGNYLLHARLDGALQIHETADGKMLADLSSKNLNCSPTCLKWGPRREVPYSPSKRKKKKSRVEDAISNLDVIAIGTESGTIILYSFARGQVHTHLEKGHTDRVTDVCWHPDCSILYSSSLDGNVIEWDVSQSQAREKWKASSGGVHSMCLCGTNRLLTAYHVIKMWDLSSKTVLQKFTGHSTEVFRLLPVLQPSSGENSQSQPYTCTYFISAAVNDRIINAWCCGEDSLEKNAVTSFALTEDPIDMNMRVTRDQTLTLAILTSKGRVLVFEHTLNGKVKKPLKPKTVVHATTSGSKKDVAVPQPVLAALPRAVTQGSGLLVAHGSALRPKFEVVTLTGSQPETVLVVASPDKAAVKGDFEQVKVPEVSGATVLYPSQVIPQGPGKEPGARRKRKKSVSELTVEERLEAMGVENRDQSSGSTKPPRADQLVVQLTQGLLSKDGRLLTNAFQERNETTITNTVRRLPLPLVHALVKEVIHRISGHAQSGLMMIRWLKEILSIHMGYLTTVPDLVDTLAELYQYIEYRTHTLPKRTVEQGKLQLLLARIASQDQVEEEPAASSEPLLVYQDESTDEEEEEMLVEFGESESEEDWDDTD